MPFIIIFEKRKIILAHHRGQVADVSYKPQRMFINSWSNVWWNIRCGRF